LPYLSSSSVAAVSDQLQCGELGSYGEQKERTGNGEYHRDHIPSKAALKERARQLNGGINLSPAQASAIENQASSVVIPAAAHREASPTYGGRNANLIEDDANDLAGAAKRDTDDMIGEIDDYADKECAKAYKQAAKEIKKKTNDDYDDFLQNILDTVD
jgi:hypothetical protein